MGRLENRSGPLRWVLRFDRPHFLSDICFLMEEAMWPSVSVSCFYTFLAAVNCVPPIL